MRPGLDSARGWVTLGLAWGLAGVFGYAGVTKALDPQGFARAVENYRLLPPLAVNLLAVCLPWWELGAAAALLWPRLRRDGAVLAGGFSFVFMLAVGSAWLKGLDISCGCFGTGSHAVGLGVFVLDLVCLGAAGGLWRLTPRPEEKVRTTS